MKLENLLFGALMKDKIPFLWDADEHGYARAG
jgi:hypothetical protein